MYLLSYASILFYLIIFIFRNIPHIHVHEKLENKEQWHGAKIQVVIEGNWTTYRVCTKQLVHAML